MAAFPVSLGPQHLHRCGLCPAHPVVGQLDGGEEHAFRGVAGLCPEDEQRPVPRDDGRVPHIFVEQPRPGPKTREAIGRAIEQAGHRQGVEVALVTEHPKVRTAEDLRAPFEVQPVARRCHSCHLALDVLPMDVHHDLASIITDMDIGRCDVDVLGRVRMRGHKVRLVEPKCARFVHGPRAGQPLGIGQPDVGATVVGEVQVVGAEGVRNPVRHADQRGACDVAAHRPVHVGRDDRPVYETFHPHVCRRRAVCGAGAEAAARRKGDEGSNPDRASHEMSRPAGLVVCGGQRGA